MFWRCAVAAAAMTVCFGWSGGALASGCDPARVAGAAGWFPISYQRDGVVDGLGMEVAKRVLTLTGSRTVARSTRLPWVESLRGLKEGSFDLIAGAYFTEQRAVDFLFTLPFAEDEIRVFTHRHRQFHFTEWNDLRGKKGNRPFGGSYGEAFDRYAEQHLDIVGVQSSSLMFRQLQVGQVDYTVLALIDGLELRQDMGGPDRIPVVPLETSVTSNPIYLMMSRNSPCVARLDAINAEIERMRASGELARLKDLYLEELNP